MRSTEQKVARLEEQNAALRRKLRHQENEISRLSVRESHLKEARRIPLLQKRLDAALVDCEDLECQIAETRSREARLFDEVTLLRKFVQLSENPELAEVARQSAHHERIQKELRDLGEQLRHISIERDEYKKRALLSCDEAEYYRDGWDTSVAEKKELEEYLRRLIAEQEPAAMVRVSPLPYVPMEARPPCLATAAAVDKSHDDDPQNLRQILAEERARSEALQETMEAMHEQMKQQRQSPSAGRGGASPAPPAVNVAEAETEAKGLVQGDVPAVVQTLRQQLLFAEAECTMLKNRWDSLRKQNQVLLARLSEQEKAEVSWKSQLHQMSDECERLKRELKLISQAGLLVSCRYSEQAFNGPSMDEGKGSSVS